jgi:hypothetical protein
LRLPRRRRPDASARPSPSPSPARGRLGTSADPPGWDGEPRGEPGIHGLARSRRWDAVVAADVPGLAGDTHAFVVLADRTLLPLDDGAAESLAPLAAAVGDAVERPYRAEAVARGAGRWAVGAVRTRVEELHGVEAAEIQFAVQAGRGSASVDGRPVFGPLPGLERIAAEEQGDVVVRAWRLAGDSWEVEVSPL